MSHRFFFTDCRLHKAFFQTPCSLGKGKRWTIRKNRSRVVLKGPAKDAFGFSTAVKNENAFIEPLQHLKSYNYKPGSLLRILVFVRGMGSDQVAQKVLVLFCENKTFIPPHRNFCAGRDFEVNARRVH